MRVLIVDDDAGLRQSLALLLQETGYDVVSEGDPEQALQRAARAGSFDLVLCDVRMPKMDGGDLPAGATAPTAGRGAAHHDERVRQ